MADVNANIGVNIDTSEALAQLKALQRQISQFHTSIAKSSESAAIAQKSLQKNLLGSINSIGAFSAELRTVKTSAESFTNSLEKNKFSMREYFRYAGASTKTFGRLFKSEFDTIGKVAEERVKTLQTQYIKMGRNASGAMEAIAIRPTSLNMQDLGTKTAIAAQKQALFNQLMKQGTTNLLNFGKNTQWAGRQLMVGFTIPLSIVGSTATKTFMDMEAQAIKFKKVYGDLFTPKAETQQALDDITELGRQFTKYGVAVSTTVGLAADAAAAGFQGLDLQRQTTEATRLSILGQIDTQKALETTISLQNAFGMSSDKLADSINFLNAVENQTVVSLDDITTAIPKVAPVIQQLGGDVKDLTFFMAAMKEGGINASEGANALKSGLASLINPTGRASEMLAAFGINAREIVTKNKGDLKATVIEFAEALNSLDPLNRAQAIEQMFGKFQFARLSALFANVTKEGNQASRVLSLANSSVEELSALSEQELGMTADSAMNKFKKSVEDLKLALVPVGKAFLEAATPIVEFVGGVLEKFGNLSSGTKRLITVLTVAVGAIGPIFLMTFGLLANALANAMKGAMILRQGYLRLTGQSQILGEQTQYLNTEQLEAAAAAHSLDQSHAKLTQQFTAETAALQKLIAAYQSGTRAGNAFMLNNPGMMMPPRGAVKKLAQGGIISGPGGPTSDSVPVMASNGEAIISAKTVKKYPGIIEGLISGNIPGFKKTGIVGGTIGTVLGGAFTQRQFSSAAMMAPGNTSSGFGMDPEWLKLNEQAKASFASALKTAGMAEAGITQTANNYNNFWQGLNPVLDGIFDIFKSGISDEITTVAQLGEKQYPLMVQHVQDLTQSSQISAEQAEQLSVSLRKLVAPLSSDRTQTDIKRIELALNEAGQTIVKRASTERFGGSLKEQTVRNFPRELSQRGLPIPSSMEDFSFAHIPQGTEESVYVEPFLRKKAGAGSAAEQKVLAELKKGASFKEGQVVANAAIQGAKEGAGSASPSKKAIPIGQDIARGLEVGMADRQDDVARAGANLATAAVGGTRGGVTKIPFSGAVAANVPKTPALNLSDVTANARINREKLLLLQQAKQTNIIEENNRKFSNLNSKIMGGTFALTSLAGMASMAGGSLGKLSGIIFQFSSIMFGISTVLQLLPKKLLTIANLIKFGPLGVAIGVTTGIIILLNKTREKERQRLEAFGDAIRNTTSQLESLGDYFGVTPTKTGLESTKLQLVVDKDTRTELDKFKSSDTFKEFASTINAVSKLSDKDATAALQAKGQELLGKGFSKEQISLILKAIQEEAGKTKLKINFASVDVDLLNESVLTDIGAELSKLPKIINDNLEEKITFRKGRSPIRQLLPNKEAKAELKNSGTMFTSYLNGITGMFKSGQISGKKFNDLFGKALQTTIRTIPQGKDQILFLNAALSQMDSELAKSAIGLTNVKDKMLIVQAAALGVGVSLAEINTLQRAMANPNDLDIQIAAEKIRQKIIKANLDITKEQEAANKKLLESYKNINNETKKKAKTELDVLKQAQDYIALQEQLIDMANAPALKAYNDELKKQEKILKGINDKIDQITQDSINPLEARIKANSYLIDQIALKEEDINKNYDLQINALTKIKTINEEIANAEKSRLSLADALTRGDISAAASIAQESRERSASFAFGRVEASLTGSRDAQIAALGRNKLEKENKQLQLDITKIQMQQIEPLNNQKLAVDRIVKSQNDLKTKLEETIEKRKSDITYLGLTKDKIDESVKALDLAQNANIDIKKDSFLRNALQLAMGDATRLEAALKAVARASAGAFAGGVAQNIESIVEGKPKTTKSKTSTKTTKTTAPAAGKTGVSIPPSRTASSGGYSGIPTSKTMVPPPSRTIKRALGGIVPKYMAVGGKIGSDTVPAMLTPGEFVINKRATQQFGPMLSMLNESKYPSMIGSSYSGQQPSSNSVSVSDNSNAVYNYNVGINVSGSNANPDGIARAVMNQIKYIDSQRIRGQK
jgi:TP901 family phage tail tape measure protein